MRLQEAWMQGRASGISPKGPQENQVVVLGKKVIFSASCLSDRSKMAEEHSFKVIKLDT